MSENKYQVLFVDDEPEARKLLLLALSERFEFALAQNIEQMDHYLDSGKRFDLMLLDLELVKGSGDLVGLRLIKPILKKRPGLPIVVVTKDESVNTIKIAQDEGAVDFLMKDDYKKEKWVYAFEKAIKIGVMNLSQGRQRHLAQLGDADTFIGESQKVKEVKQVLEFVSKSPGTPLLILGETGTGKEVAAKYLHSLSPRKHKPLVAENLSAIQETLLESTLFGHVKGAFTGADREREGLFKQANGGILMLDEIGDIKEDIQIKLLRFLEDKKIRPVGSDHDVKLDVQIIAATHRNLENRVKKGLFREDLYMRLKSMSIILPPLRERKDDIALLLQHFMGDPFNSVEGFSADAWEYLMQFYWPGNIRQLRNSIAPMLYKQFTKGHPVIDVSCLPAEILAGGTIEQHEDSLPTDIGRTTINFSQSTGSAI